MIQTLTLYCYYQHLCNIVDDSDDEDAGVQTSATIMVPMADLLNHVPDHNAELNLGESTFRMVAVKDIKKVCYRSVCYIMVVCVCLLLCTFTVVPILLFVCSNHRYINT